MGLDLTRDFVPVSIAVMTISDSRTLEDDKSGDVLAQRLSDAGHQLSDRVIIQDEEQDIITALQGFISDKAIDVVIATGGTGLTGRDVTPEAFRAVARPSA